MSYNVSAAPSKKDCVSHGHANWPDDHEDDGEDDDVAVRARLKANYGTHAHKCERKSNARE